MTWVGYAIGAWIALGFLSVEPLLHTIGRLQREDKISSEWANPVRVAAYIVATIAAGPIVMGIAAWNDWGDRK